MAQLIKDRLILAGIRHANHHFCVALYGTDFTNVTAIDVKSNDHTWTLVPGSFKKDKINNEWVAQAKYTVVKNAKAGTPPPAKPTSPPAGKGSKSEESGNVVITVTGSDPFPAIALYFDPPPIM